MVKTEHEYYYKIINNTYPNNSIISKQGLLNNCHILANLVKKQWKNI